MTPTFKIPLYAKTVLIGLGIYIFVSIFNIGQNLLIPVVFGTLIAILLHPVVNFFVRLKINRLLAIIITLLLSIVLIASFGIFMYSQFNNFSDSWPILVERITSLFNDTIAWLPGYFDISAEKLNEWMQDTQTKLMDSSGTMIGSTLLSVGSVMATIFLVPVYVFLLLYYKPLLVEVIHKLFGADHSESVNRIITDIKSVVQQYLVGLFMETVIIAAMNVTALLILGIQYAVLIGVVGALINLIPYIGGLVAVTLPMMIALVTKSSPWFALVVLGVFYFIQLVDNNLIVPRIVASKVKINAFMSIFIVLAGGALWGVAGMFLAIPVLAIVKVICDRVESLNPIGLLLGDTMPTIELFKIKKVKRKKTVKDVSN